MLCSFEDENVRKTLNIYSPKKKNHFPKLFHLFDKKLKRKIIITIRSHMYVSQKSQIQQNNILQKNLLCI